MLFTKTNIQAKETNYCFLDNCQCIGNNIFLIQPCKIYPTYRPVDYKTKLINCCGFVLLTFPFLFKDTKKAIHFYGITFSSETISNSRLAQYK